jgi:hypothetical protein
MSRPLLSLVSARKTAQVGAAAFDTGYQAGDRVELIERVIELIGKPLAVQPRPHDLGQPSVTIVRVYSLSERVRLTGNGPSRALFGEGIRHSIGYLQRHGAISSPAAP